MRRGKKRGWGAEKRYLHVAYERKPPLKDFSQSPGGGEGSSVLCEEERRGRRTVGALYRKRGEGRSETKLRRPNPSLLSGDASDPAAFGKEGGEDRESSAREKRKRSRFMPPNLGLKKEFTYRERQDD